MGIVLHTEKKNLPSLLLTWPASSVSCDSEAATREELAIHAIMKNSVVKYFMIYNRIVRVCLERDKIYGRNVLLIVDARKRWRRLESQGIQREGRFPLA